MTGKQIINAHGSIQEIDVFNEWEKDVFKTAFELDQNWLVQHAADRQPYICQSQSLNLFFPAGSDKNYVAGVHLRAWRDGLKSLYYLRTSAGKTAEKISKKVERVSLSNVVEQEECLACHA